MDSMSPSDLTRRKFFVHSAHKTIGVSVSLAALQAYDVDEGFAAADPPAAPVRVCLVSGSLEYKSDESFLAFEKHLEKTGQAKCTRAFRKSDTELPGLENLEACDCAIFFTRRLRIAGEPLERVQKFCRSGKGIIGLRTASHGFQEWLAMDKEVYGGDYQGHFDKQPVEVKIVAAAKDHAILKGVEPFTSQGSLYRNPNIAKDTTALLTGTIPGNTYPVAWTRLHHKARVFYTSLGAFEDFQSPSFLRLLSNAVMWVNQRG